MEKAIPTDGRETADCLGEEGRATALNTQILGFHYQFSPSAYRLFLAASLAFNAEISKALNVDLRRGKIAEIAAALHRSCVTIHFPGFNTKSDSDRQLISYRITRMHYKSCDGIWPSKPTSWPIGFVANGIIPLLRAQEDITACICVVDRAVIYPHRFLNPFTISSPHCVALCMLPAGHAWMPAVMQGQCKRL